jgi:hypothetical protein
VRTFTKFSTSEVKLLLQDLLDSATDSQKYRASMQSLGLHLAASLFQVQSFLERTSLDICVACSVEDADFLASGFIDGLKARGIEDSRLKLVCFWNERIKSFVGESAETFDIAPIIKTYREVKDLSNSVLVIVKSIISGACIVKTNLSDLIDDSTPQQIFVLAPVMLKGAKKRLETEFSKDVAAKFQYLAFAEDDQKLGEFVDPGIGGSVYERLGFDDKNSYVPKIVIDRRQALAA